MVDHTHAAFGYATPTPATNADDLPAALLDRAITVLHNIMIGGGSVENWTLQMLDNSNVEVEELPDKLVWSHKAGNEKLRAAITRDGNNYITVIVYAFAPDGTTYTTIKTATLTRGTNGGVKNIDWS
jgi:hypothetical protein